MKKKDALFFIALIILTPILVVALFGYVKLLLIIFPVL
jgi:hypothetical protein